MNALDTFPSERLVPSPRRLKQEAKQIRQTHPQFQHRQALDQAAKARGWSSYAACEQAWRTKLGREVGPHHQVTLSAQWTERDSGNGWGRIHAHVMLSEPWPNFLPLGVRRNIGTQRQFRVAHGNRAKLVAHETFASYINCIHNLSKAARQLVFVDALRVLPATYAKTLRAFGDDDRMLTERYPNQDHESLWEDPSTGLHFILNEPYQVDHDRQAPVLGSRGMVAFTAQTWTIHNPTGTLAQLIAPVAAREHLKVLAKNCEVLPERFKQITFTSDEGETLPIFRASTPSVEPRPYRHRLGPDQ